MNVIKRKLTKNKSSCVITINQELMSLLGYKNEVFITVDENQNLVLMKEDTNGQNKEK